MRTSQLQKIFDLKVPAAPHVKKGTRLKLYELWQRTLSTATFYTLEDFIPQSPSDKKRELQEYASKISLCL